MPNGATEEHRSEEQVPADETEAIELEVVDSKELQSSESVEALATFSEREEPFSYTVIPVIQNGTTDWRIVIYKEGAQEQVYNLTEKIPDDVADELGMTSRLHDRINKAFNYADQNLRIPPELGDQSRQKKTLHQLEIMMEEQ